MGKVLLAFACVAALVVADRPSRAGAVRSNTVIINSSTSSAQGSLGAVYHSGDSNQFIGCTVGYSSTSSVPVTTCFAQDASSNLVTCTASVTVMATAMGTVTTDSYIQFTWTAMGGTNTCTSITVTADSRDQPK
jgi:hypothetical protein